MFKYVLLVFFAFSVVGCGTVVRGTKQGVRFESTPEGASVKVVRAKKRKTEWNCTSPCEIQLSRKRDFDVTYTLAGYKPAQGRLASRLGAKGGATAIPGNFVAGGGIGFIVDAGTGANMQLKPDPMRAKLAALDSDEESVIFDVRIEGGGVEDVYVGEPVDENASNPSGLQSAPKESGLKRLPRELGLTGAAVTSQSEIAAQMSDPNGVQITEIDPDGAAKRASLRVGDVIQAVNSNRVSTIEELNELLSKVGSGQVVSFVIWRDREQYEASVEF